MTDQEMIIIGSEYYAETVRKHGFTVERTQRDYDHLGKQILKDLDPYNKIRMDWMIPTWCAGLLMMETYMKDNGIEYEKIEIPRIDFHIAAYFGKYGHKYKPVEIKEQGESEQLEINF